MLFGPSPVHFTHPVGNAQFEFLIEPGKLLGQHRQFVEFLRSHAAPAIGRLFADERAQPSRRYRQAVDTHAKRTQRIFDRARDRATMRPPSPRSLHAIFGVRRRCHQMANSHLLGAG